MAALIFTRKQSRFKDEEHGVDTSESCGMWDNALASCFAFRLELRSLATRIANRLEILYISQT